MLSQTFNQDASGNIGVAALAAASGPTLTAGQYSSLSLTLTGLLRVDGSGVTQPISATSLPLPTGAATSALQTAGNTTLTAISGQLPASLGSKTSANSLSVVLASDEIVPISATALPLPAGAATAALQSNVQSAPGTSASTAITVQGSATGVAIPISAASLPLPTGASTAALQTAGNTTLSTISGQLPTTLGAKTSANSLSVVLATDDTLPISLPTSSTATQTNVTSSATSVAILASNANRKGMIVFNDSNQILYLSFAATASTTAYAVKLFPNSAYTSDFIYTGAVSGIWAAANGAARVTEFT